MVLAGLAVACRDPMPVAAPDAAEAPEASALDLTDPEACAPCHAAVVEAWRGSMHAQAHTERDPLYGAMHALRTEKQGAALTAACAECHNPQAPEAPDSPAGRAGVGCLACHAVERVDRGDGKMGRRALPWSDPVVLRGPHDLGAEASPVHRTGKSAPHLTDGTTICLACHDSTETPRGVAACTTGPEHRAAEDGATCTGCHMPWVDAPSGAVSTRARHRSHAFLGPHRLWQGGDDGFMAGAADLEATFEGGTLVVRLENRSSHGFPSGFPGRQVTVRVEGFDRAGLPFEIPEPTRTLGKVYVDDAGAPTMAAFSAALKEDTRLRPGERREFRFPVSERVARVDVSLLFALAPKPLFVRLGLGDRPESTPRVVSTQTVQRSPRSARPF